MATYAQFRTALKSTLQTLVTAGTLKRVYEYPPSSLEDEPSVVMLGSSGRGEFSVGEGNMLETNLTESLRIFCSDYEGVDAALTLETLRVAVVSAIAANNGMDGTGTIYAIEWDVPAGYNYAGVDFTGMTLRLPFVLD